MRKVQFTPEVNLQIIKTTDNIVLKNTKIQSSKIYKWEDPLKS